MPSTSKGFSPSSTTAAPDGTMATTAAPAQRKRLFSIHSSSTAPAGNLSGTDNTAFSSPRPAFWNTRAPSPNLLPSAAMPFPPSQTSSLSSVSSYMTNLSVPTAPLMAFSASHSSALSSPASSYARRRSVSEDSPRSPPFFVLPRPGSNRPVPPNQAALNPNNLGQLQPQHQVVFIPAAPRPTRRARSASRSSSSSSSFPSPPLLPYQQLRSASPSASSISSTAGEMGLPSAQQQQNPHRHQQTPISTQSYGVVTAPPVPEVPPQFRKAGGAGARGLNAVEYTFVDRTAANRDATRGRQDASAAMMNGWH
ncbi:hypothetical protein DFJ73DRAFT_781562 [Zopfochytrium polystomum]|nr:hypothetical protein DFJ73DRAFT_781562 [Zopfochytrium polystomum]